MSPKKQNQFLGDQHKILANITKPSIFYSSVILKENNAPHYVLRLYTDNNRYFYVL